MQQWGFLNLVIICWRLFWYLMYFSSSSKILHMCCDIGRGNWLLGRVSKFMCSNGEPLILFLNIVIICCMLFWDLKYLLFWCISLQQAWSLCACAVMAMVLYLLFLPYINKSSIFISKKKKKKKLHFILLDLVCHMFKNVFPFF